MTEEIRPPQIPLPRRIRPVSPEDREENDERFRKKLAELARQGEGEPEEKRQAKRGAAAPEAAQSGGAEERDEDSKLGGNLDLRT